MLIIDGDEIVGVYNGETCMLYGKPGECVKKGNVVVFWDGESSTVFVNGKKVGSSYDRVVYDFFRASPKFERAITSMYEVRINDHVDIMLGDRYDAAKFRVFSKRGKRATSFEKVFPRWMGNKWREIFRDGSTMGSYHNKKYGTLEIGGFYLQGTLENNVLEVPGYLTVNLDEVMGPLGKTRAELLDEGELYLPIVKSRNGEIGTIKTKKGQKYYIIIGDRLYVSR